MRHLDMDARIAGEGEDRFEEPGVADEIPAPRRDRLPRDRHNGGGSNRPRTGNAGTAPEPSPESTSPA